MIKNILFLFHFIFHLIFIYLLSLLFFLLTGEANWFKCCSSAAPKSSPTCTTLGSMCKMCEKVDAVPVPNLIPGLLNKRCMVIKNYLAVDQQLIRLRLMPFPPVCLTGKLDTSFTTVWESSGVSSTQDQGKTVYIHELIPNQII